MTKEEIAEKYFNALQSVKTSVINMEAAESHAIDVLAILGNSKEQQVARLNLRMAYMAAAAAVDEIDAVIVVADWSENPTTDAVN